MIKTIFSITILIFFFGATGFAQDSSKKERERKILEALDDEIILLEGYLKFISNKDFDLYERNSQIERILKRFEPGANIQVSNLHTQKITPKPARTYFENLRDFQKYGYDEVEIYFIKSKAGNLNPISKTTYTANGYYLQVFIGKKNGNDIYRDLTEKGIEFKVDYITKPNGTTDIKIIFSNIKVLSTSELILKD